MATKDPEKPTDRIRVKHIGTGHHSTIARKTFDPEAHVLLKTPAVDKSGRDVPPKYHVTKSGSSATATRTARSTPTGATPAATSKHEESQE